MHSSSEGMDLKERLRHICKRVHRRGEGARIRIETQSGRMILAQDVTVVQSSPWGWFFQYARAGSVKWDSLWLKDVKDIDVIASSDDA